MGVIVVDRGLVEDHLPNNVLKALLRCQDELVGPRHSPADVSALRKEEAAKIDKLIGMIYAKSLQVWVDRKLKGSCSCELL